jgi:hypothetical protein
MKKLFILLALPLLANFVFTNCSKDDEAAKDYEGTWVRTATHDDGTETMTLTISGSDITMVSETVDNDNVKSTFAFKGSNSVAGDIMTITINEIGVAGTDGAIVYYKSGSDEFKAFAENFGDLTMKIKYSVSGNKLTIISDENGDGVYDEDSEVWTKK